MSAAAGKLTILKAKQVNCERGYVVKMFRRLAKNDYYLLAETLVRLTEPGRVLWVAPHRPDRILQNDLRALAERGCTLVFYPEGITTMDLKQELLDTIDAMKPAPAVMVLDDRGEHSAASLALGVSPLIANNRDDLLVVLLQEGAGV